MSQATIEARIWRELDDEESNGRTYSQANVDLAIVEEAIQLSTDDRIGADYRRGWMYADSAVTLTQGTDGTTEIDLTTVSSTPLKILSLILDDEDGNTLEISDVVGPESRRMPREFDEDHPLPLDAIFVMNQKFYVSGDYETQTAKLHYIPTMTLAIAVTVHQRLEDALVFGAASRLIAQREPQAALILHQRKEASLPLSRRTFTVNPLF